MIRVRYKPDGDTHEFTTAVVAEREVVTRQGVTYVGDWLLKTRAGDSAGSDGTVVAVIGSDSFLSIETITDATDAGS